ncbi:YbbR-like domain-containing protein [bacterium]|nr:YbbR-like domain-containing protein [bacterium]
MRDRLRKMLLDNLPYKVTAVILASMLWYIVQGEEILEVNKRIAVTVAVPDGYTIKGPTLRYKDATLRGPRVLLGQYMEGKKPLEATIKIPPGKAGQLRYRVDRENLTSFDPRVRMTIHDPYIVVTVDEVSGKKVPVREVIEGVPAQGYMIEKIVIDPESVKVTGLKADLAKVNQVATEQINISGLKQPKVFEVRFGSIPVEVVGSDYLTNVRPQFATIVIQGTPGVLSFVKKADLRAFVDVRDLTPGRYDREIQVKIPSETVMIETHPKSTSVEIYNQKRLR